jgi:threonine synthase
MSFSALSFLQCSRCGREWDADVLTNLCECGGPLLARYDLESVTIDPDDIAGRDCDLWRYHELLPVRSAGQVVSLGEGMTPLLALPRLGERLGVPRLLLKDESLLPTGSFKARGAAVGVSRAVELGARVLSMPTNGNAGAAWAAYAARASVRISVAMPVDAPSVTRAEVAVTGAELTLVRGHIGQAGQWLARKTAALGAFDVSTLKEPYRIEGKKTMALEIVEQLGWRLPDVIVYPTGGGVGLIGMHKALTEVRELGWAEGELARLVCVQSAGCAPIVRAFEQGESWCHSHGFDHAASPSGSRCPRRWVTSWSYARCTRPAAPRSRSMTRPSSRTWPWWDGSRACSSARRVPPRSAPYVTCAASAGCAPTTG